MKFKFGQSQSLVWFRLASDADYKEVTNVTFLQQVINIVLDSGHNTLPSIQATAFILKCFIFFPV